MTTVLYREDVAVGDEVKNGRNGRWGKVVALHFASGSDRIIRVRVRRMIGLGTYQREPTWWLADNIIMTEKGSTK